MKVSLQDWLKFGWLKEHKTSRQEIADLLAVADRDLEACQTRPKTRPDESGRGRVRLCATSERNIADYDRADTCPAHPLFTASNHGVFGT